MRRCLDVPSRYAASGLSWVCIVSIHLLFIRGMVPFEIGTGQCRRAAAMGRGAVSSQTSVSKQHREDIVSVAKWGTK